jgi:hypothetical protein
MTIGSVTSGTPSVGMVLSGGWISTGAYNDYNVLIVGKAQLYREVTPNSTSGTGYGAQFNVSKSNGVYRVERILNEDNDGTGDGFNVRDVIKIKGSKLGGRDGINDLLITVASILGTGQDLPIASINWTGIASITDVYNNIEQDDRIGVGGGVGAKFKITKVGSAYQVEATYPGIDYTAGDMLLVNGSQLGGANTTNDLIVTVTKTRKTYTDLVQYSSSYGGSGINAVFRVTRNGNQYVDIAIT